MDDLIIIKKWMNSQIRMIKYCSLCYSKYGRLLIGCNHPKSVFLWANIPRARPKPIATLQRSPVEFPVASLLLATEVGGVVCTHELVVPEWAGHQSGQKFSHALCARVVPT